MKELPQILKNLKDGKYAPVYFLHGEEPYYIDLITNYIEKHALDEAAKGFNQIVLYGRDVRMNDILGNARRFPMMSERQVVIVKEAQNIIDLRQEAASKLMTDYLANPLPSTILVICHKYKAFDKRKALYKAFVKHAIVLESTKVRDYEMPTWIKNYFTEKGFKITEKGAHMLSESIGNNLERLTHEVNKMLINFKEPVEVNDKIIEKYIGISKEYNVFELQKAINYKDIHKANKIASYFEANPKSNPVIFVLGVLYAYFSKLLAIHESRNITEQAIMSNLRINSFIAKEYAVGARNYPLHKIIEIIHGLRHADMQSKGVVASNMPDGQILKELLFKILY